MIEEILPRSVVAEEAFVDPDEVTLLPEEETVVARAVAGRRAEFATARHCARAAMRRLGMPPAPILPGPRGAPMWPPGIVGSMTHCAGYRAAALAHERDVVSIGIDAEPHDELPDGVLRLVSCSAEREMLARLGAAAPETWWDRLLFSAKESVYKTWFPLTGRWLDFAEAEVAVNPTNGRFVAQLLVPGPELAGRRWQEFHGRYLISDGLVLTAIVVAR